MRRYSNDKDINQEVRMLIKSGWKIKNGSKHARVISPTGYHLTVPSTPSDRRAWLNFSRDIRHIINKQGILNAC
jgi:hypothetical protein